MHCANLLLSGVVYDHQASDSEVSIAVFTATRVGSVSRFKSMDSLRMRSKRSAAIFAYMKSRPKISKKIPLTI